MIRRPRFLLLVWALVAVVILAADFSTGPIIQFPFLFLAPVALASWYNGWRWGLAFALVLSLARFWFATLWPVPWSLVASGINTVIRIAVLGAFALLIDRVATEHRRLAQELRVLRGILPICSACKKIRTADGSWQQIEQYIRTHSEAEFTHSICPECARRLYGDLVDGK